MQHPHDPDKPAVPAGEGSLAGSTKTSMNIETGALVTRVYGKGAS